MVDSILYIAHQMLHQHYLELLMYQVLIFLFLLAFHGTHHIMTFLEMIVQFSRPFLCPERTFTNPHDSQHT